MARRRGTCRNCGKTRAFYDEDHLLCQECAALLERGEITAPAEKLRGRKPDIEDQKNDNKTSKDDQENDTTLECEGCGGSLYYGQAKCPHCGIYPDWRGTRLENDPDALICPDCGAYMGLIESNPTKCPHCGFR